MKDQQKPNQAAPGDASQKKGATSDPTKKVSIHRAGANTYRADPTRGRQQPDGEVTFDNQAGDDVQLAFAIDGTARTPFGGSQPYSVPGNGSLPLIVRSDADKGTYDYTITKAALAGGPPAEGGVPEESPAESEKGQEYSSRAMAFAKTAPDGGINPEMIIF